MTNSKKTLLIFLVIFLAAIFIRSYKLPTLTTFGGDQGQDFLVVRDMAVSHKWTLLGIKTSAYAFFQGPVYLYMLLPFFWLLQLQPISGAIAAIFYSMLTLIILFITVKKYFSDKAALISTALLAVSPALVVYGNTPLYQHFLPLFVISSIYLFLYPRKNFWTGAALGTTLGLGVETHLLNISLMTAVLLLAVIIEKKQGKWLAGNIGGIITGLSPTIVFELRHNFLNTRYLLGYHTAGGAKPVLAEILVCWAEGAGIFIGANSTLLGAGILIFILAAIIFMKSKTTDRSLARLALLLIPVILVFSWLFNAFQPFYMLPFWLLALMMLPVLIEQIFPGNTGVIVSIILVLANLFASIKQMNINHGYTMPEGWSLARIEKAARIIGKDAQTHPNFNVASLLDSPSRAYPIRYTLLASGSRPEPVENYPANNFLYLVIRGGENEVIKTNIFEVASFKPYTIGSSWELGEGIFLYRLDRNSWIGPKE